MDHYEIWCDIKDSHKDLQFASDVSAYLGRLKEQGLLERFGLSRRKLGFGPDSLGEFHVSIAVQDMMQLERLFEVIAARSGEIESLHAKVYSQVVNFKAALYRDFPDPQRTSTKGA